ncbi:MAG: LytTR family DNA-binding domain-containing protein [Lachnospiraceae bacterium]|nr:LytTR family DNA-binding domain-containing protein [Lachnospiraceae bacterium]
MKTVTIMVCDDDRALREILRSKIEKMCWEAEAGCRIVCCDSGEEILDLRGEEAPDILFLDIQMPGKSGMEIAEELRKQHRDTILIFVTALSEYVYEAFDVGAFHYLVKPFSDDKLKEVLSKALRQYKRQQEIAELRRTDDSIMARADSTDRPLQDIGEDADRYRNGQVQTPAAILVKRGGVSTRVLLEDIIYAEVFNRKVMLHTTGGDIEYYGKLTELSEQTGEDFYRTHRAYLVNLKYVEKYNATTIWLEKGSVLVSKKQYAGFVRRYMRYINRKRSR